MKAYLCVAFFQNVLVASNENFFFFFFHSRSSFVSCSQIWYSFLVFLYFLFIYCSYFFLFYFRNENVSRRKIKEERQNVWPFFFFLSLFHSFSLPLSLPRSKVFFFSFQRRWNKYVLKKRTLYFYKRKNTYYMYTYIHIFNYPTYSTYN